MAKAKTTNNTYRGLVTRSKEEIDNDQLDINVAHAENDLDIGINNVYGQVITAEGNLKKNRSRIVKAEQLLNDAKAAFPFNVQTILDRRTELLQERANITAEEIRLESIKETHQYLQDLKAELFPS